MTRAEPTVYRRLSHVSAPAVLLLSANLLVSLAAGRALAAADSTAAGAPAVVAVPAPRLSGYLQARESWQEAAGWTLLLNRVRFAIDGALPSKFSYRILTELEASAGPRSPATVSLREAYVRWSPAPFTFTAGEFKSPFSREYLVPVPELELADLAVAVDSLAPKYDVGVMAEYAHGATATIALGAFNGEGANTTANRDSTVLVVGRATARPLPQLALGASFARDGADSLRWGVDASVQHRGAVVRAEYVTRRRGLEREEDDFGWYVFESFRVLPRLQVLARQEDFQRPGYGASRRVRGLAWGAAFDVAPNRVRLLGELSRRMSGRAQQHADVFLAQAQVRF